MRVSLRRLVRSIPVVFAPLVACGASSLPPLRTPGATGAAAEQIVQTSHRLEVTSLAFSPDGTHLASASPDGSIRIWEPTRRTLLRVIRVTDSRDDIGLSWENDRRVVANLGLEARVYDIEWGERITRVEPQSHVESLRRFEGASGRRWGAITGACREIVFLDEYWSPIETVAPPACIDRIEGSTDGAVVFGSTLDPKGDARDLFVMHPGTGGNFQKVDLGGASVHAYAVSPKGDAALVATASPDGVDDVRVVATNDLHEICRVPHDSTNHEKVDLAAVTPNGVTGVVEVGAWLHAIDMHTCATTWTESRVLSSAVAFSPNGQSMALGDKIGFTSSYDVATGRPRGYFGNRIRDAQSIAFPTPDLVVVGAFDLFGQRATKGSLSSLSFWSLSKGALVAASRDGGPTGGVSALGDGQLVFSEEVGLCAKGGKGVAFSSPRSLDAYAKGSSKMMTAETFDALPQAPWPPALGGESLRCAGAALTVQSGFDAKRAFMWRIDFVSTTQDSLSLVDLRTNRVTVLRGSEMADHVVVSRDGSRIAAIHGPTFLAAVWDTRTGERVADLAPLGKTPIVALAPDGSAAAVYADDEIRVAALPSGKLVSHTSAPAYTPALAFGATAHDLLAADKAAVVTLYRDGVAVARTDSGGGAVDEIVVDPSGARAVTRSQDGGVRVWSTATGDLLAQLVDFDDGEWAIVTPDGRFDGTPEVGTRFGWVFASPLEYFGADHFPSFSSHGDVVAALADAPKGLHVDRPPHVDIVEAPHATGATAAIRVHGSPTARTVHAFVEGREVATQALSDASDATLNVPVRPGENRVAVVAFDARGFASNEVFADVTSDRVASVKPDLWIVTVGVGSYPFLDGLRQLPAATRDAQGVADAFSKLAGGDAKKLYAAAHVVTLLDDAVTPATVKQAIGQLAAMKEDDLAVVLFAGHGYKSATDDMVFVLGTFGAGGRDRPEDVAASSIGWRDIAEGLSHAHGRVALFVDACHSGAITKDTAHTEDLAAALLKGDRSGLLVFSAAKGRQPSLEPGAARTLTLETTQMRSISFDPKAPHGYFTGALLAALDDPATDSDHDGAIETGELIDEVTQRVTIASGYAQVPWVAKRDYFGDFALAQTPSKDGK